MLKLIREYYKNDGVPRHSLKIDSMEEYNSIKWEFLLKLMKCMGFLENFTYWIQDSISVVQFSVNLISALPGLFQTEKGIRQVIHIIYSYWLWSFLIID